MMKRQKFGGLLAAALLALVGCEDSGTRAYDAPEGTMRSVSYDMSGTVSEIDPSSAVMTLQADGATSKLPFDTTSMTEIKEGDSVTAHLTLTKITGDPSKRAFDAPEIGKIPPPQEKSLGHRDVTGKIENINHSTGDVSVRVGASTFQLHFPSAAVRDFKDGDAVALRTTFARG
jgi:hypothetical protein